MSGTSLDGVSTALVRITDDPLTAQLVAFRQEPYGAAERGQIVETIARGGSKDLALLHVALGERFAGAILQLLAGSGTPPRAASTPRRRSTGTGRARAAANRSNGCSIRCSPIPTSLSHRPRAPDESASGSSSPIAS